MKGPYRGGGPRNTSRAHRHGGCRRRCGRSSPRSRPSCTSRMVAAWCRARPRAVRDIAGLSGAPYRNDLGMGGSVVMEVDFVAALADDLAVADDDAADRVLAVVVGALASERDRALHRGAVLSGPGHRCPHVSDHGLNRNDSRRADRDVTCGTVPLSGIIAGSSSFVRYRGEIALSLRFS